MVSEGLETDEMYNFSNGLMGGLPEINGEKWRFFTMETWKQTISFVIR